MPEQETGQTPEQETGDDITTLETEALRDMINDTAPEYLGEEYEPTADEEVEPEDPAEETTEQEEETETETETETEGGETEEQAAQETAAPEAEEEIPDVTTARLDELGARVKHFESVAGREAGRSGFLEQENQRLKAQVAQLQQQPARPATDEYGEPDPGAPLHSPAQHPAPRRAEPDQNSLYLSASAVTGAINGWISQHPEVATQEAGQVLFSDESRDLISRYQSALLDLAQSGDAAQAAHQTNQILSGIWSEIEVGRATRRREQAEQRRADQAKGLREKKLGASTAASGGRTDKPTRKPKTLRELKKSELARMIDSRVGLD